MTITKFPKVTAKFPFNALTMKGGLDAPYCCSLQNNEKTFLIFLPVD